MVNVGMGDNNIINASGVEGEVVVVIFIPALLQAAVNEDSFSVYLKAVTAAGHSVGSAEK